MSIPAGVVNYTPELIGNFERNQAFSVSAWVNIAANKNQPIVSRMDPGSTLRGWFLYITTTRALGVFMINDITATPTPNEINIRSQFAALFALNTWTHIVLTYSGSSTAAGLIFYVNGAAQTGNIVSTDNLTATMQTTSAVHLQVGNNPVYSFLNGKIDEVQIYDKVLSGAEVTALYNAGAGTETMASGNNYLQYKFNEASGFQCADSTNKGRGAVAQGGATFAAGKLNNCVVLNGSTQFVQAI